MQVAVLGTGGIGLGYAAFLKERGHEPVLWSPSGEGIKAFAEGRPLTAEGVVSTRFVPLTAADPAAAVVGADIVLLALPGNAHRRVIDAITPHLEAGQTVIISAQLSMSGLYLARRLAARGLELPIVAWATTVLTGRKTGPTDVRVATLRPRLDVAALPASRSDEALALCNSVFGERFVRRPDLLAIALSNLNPPVHMANALANLTRIERGEAWNNYECMTPVVGRLIEALDRERLGLARAFGVEVRSVHEHFHLSFEVPIGAVADMAAAIHAKRGGPPGPTSLDTRYVTEDVPMGLVPLIALSRLADRPMPLHEAGIALFSAFYGRDFEAENDLLPVLGIESMDAAELRRCLRDGLLGQNKSDID